MKKSLIYTVVVTCMVAFLLSFSTINKNNIFKVSKLNSCGSGVTNLRITRESGGYVTFAWDGVNAPDHYNYGGYYQSPPSNFSGTVYGNAVSIPEGSGGRFSVLAVCADGTTGGSENMLFQ